MMLHNKQMEKPGKEVIWEYRNKFASAAINNLNYNLCCNE